MHAVVNQFISDFLPILMNWGFIRWIQALLATFFELVGLVTIHTHLCDMTERTENYCGVSCDRCMSDCHHEFSSIH